MSSSARCLSLLYGHKVEGGASSSRLRQRVGSEVSRQEKSGET